MEREEIERIAEGVVKLALAQYHAENLSQFASLRAEGTAQFAELKSRIIKIDGNGTGRNGVIQEVQSTLETQDGKIDKILDVLSEAKGALNLRQRLTAGLVAIATLAIGVFGLLISLRHK